MSILSFFLYFVSLLILMSCGDTTTDEPTSSQSGDSPSIVRPTIALDEPSSSPGNNPRPTFLVSGLQEGQIVQLFSDSTCQTSASGPSSGTEARITIDPALSEETEHTFYFSVTTNEDSVCSTESIAYTLDITPPSLSSLENDSEPKRSKNWTWSVPDDPDAQFRFTFTSNDTHTFEEEDSFSTTNTATTVGANLEDGTHYLHVEARDLAGNTSLSVSSVVFTLDTSAAIPSLELSSNSPSPGVLTTPTFDVSGLEENARVQLFSDENCEMVASDEVTNSSGTSRQVTVNSGIITADGPYSFYAKQTDSLGHVSECSVASRYVYDSSLFQVTGLTSDSTPSRTKSFSWQSNVSSGTVEFRSIINQNASYQFTAQDSWDSTTTLSKNDGTGTFYLHVQASSGGLRTEILSISFVLDNTAPDAPSAVALPSNISMFGQNLTPSFVVSGLEVGANVELFSDSACQNSVSNSVLNDSGTQISITSNNLQTDNEYNFYAKQTDTAGNPSNCSTANAAYTLDTSAPSAPSALVYSGTASSPSNSRTPTIEVQGLEENARVQLFNDSTCSTEISSEVTNTNGTDEVLTSTAITGADGTYHFYAKQTDRAGNASACSTALEYVLDITPPSAPAMAMETPFSNIGNNDSPTVSLTGLVVGDNYSFYKTLDCTGEAFGEAAATDTSASYTFSSLGTSAVYVFSAKSVDEAGNISDCSSSISYTLDLDPPSPPVLALTVPSVSISNDNTPTIEASGLVIGESISFYKSDDCSGTALGEAITNTNTHSYTFEALGSDGAYSFSARSTDLAGNTACSTTPLAYTLDTAITTPSLALATGTLNPGADVSPEFLASGLEVGARVQLFSDSTCSTVAGSEVANSSGTDELLTSSDLANDETFSFYVKQTDTAGNSACSTTAVSYELDSSLFVVTGLQNGTSAVQSQTWSWGASPTNLSGTFRHIINQDATFTFNDTDHTWNTTTTATKDTESGRYYLHVQAQSTGNNTSAVVSVYVDLDNTAPTAPQGIAFGDEIRSPFSDTTPSFVVSALEEGGSVQLFSDSTCDTSASELVANASGSDEEVTVQTLTGGDVSYSFYAKQTDIAGNVSPCSTATIAYVLDTTSPDAPTGIRLAEWTQYNGNDTTPSLIVDGLEENAQVQLFTDSACSVQASGSVTNSSGRDQEITTSTLTGGDISYSFYARQTDQAGNHSACTATAVNYRLDTVSPSAPSALALGSSMRSPFNDQTPTILVSGLEVGATVQLFSDNLCSTTASDTVINSSGTDEEVTTSSLAGGDMSYSFYAKQTDKAGNASPLFQRDSVLSIGYVCASHPFFTCSYTAIIPVQIILQNRFSQWED